MVRPTAFRAEARGFEPSFAPSFFEIYVRNEFTIEVINTLRTRKEISGTDDVPLNCSLLVTFE